MDSCSPTATGATLQANLVNVVGYAGGPAVLCDEGKLIVFPSGSLLVLQDLDSFSLQSQKKSDKDIWRLFNQSGSLLSKGVSVNYIDRVSHYHQAFLRGHEKDISALELSLSERLLASYESGQHAALILWDMRHGKRLVTFHPHKGDIINVGFSMDNSLMVTCGNDTLGRIEMIVWDTQRLFVDKSSLFAKKSRMIPKHAIIARQVSDYHVLEMKFFQHVQSWGGTDKFKPFLVSCGRENIRFWRIRKGHLPGRPIKFTRHSKGCIFTKIAFCEKNRLLFVASNDGILVKIDPDKEQTICSYRLHDCPILSLVVQGTIVATSSADKHLCVWPISFCDYLLRAKHEGEISSLQIVKNGREILVGNLAGTLGILNVRDHSFRTILRSHIGCINCCVTRTPLCDEYVTTGQDGTIRIWDSLSGQQKFELTSVCDEPKVACYHTLLDCQHLAVGFASGYLRIFDMSDICLVTEQKCYSDEVVRLLYAPDGRRLYSVHADGTLILYETYYYTIIKIIKLYEESCLKSKFPHVAINCSGTLLAVSGYHVSSLLVYSTKEMHLFMRYPTKNSTTNASFCRFPLNCEQPPCSNREYERKSGLKMEKRYESNHVEDDNHEIRMSSSGMLKDTNYDPSYHVQVLLFCNDVAVDRLLIITKTSIISLSLRDNKGDDKKDFGECIGRNGMHTTQFSPITSSQLVLHENCNGILSLSFVRHLVHSPGGFKREIHSLTMSQILCKFSQSKENTEYRGEVYILSLYQIFPTISFEEEVVFTSQDSSKVNMPVICVLSPHNSVVIGDKNGRITIWSINEIENRVVTDRKNVMNTELPLTNIPKLENVQKHLNDVPYVVSSNNKEDRNEHAMCRTPETSVNSSIYDTKDEITPACDDNRMNQRTARRILKHHINTIRIDPFSDLHPSSTENALDKIDVDIPVLESERFKHTKSRMYEEGYYSTRRMKSSQLDALDIENIEKEKEYLRYCDYANDQIVQGVNVESLARGPIRIVEETEAWENERLQSDDAIDERPKEIRDPSSLIHIRVISMRCLTSPKFSCGTMVTSNGTQVRVVDFDKKISSTLFLSRSQIVSEGFTVKPITDVAISPCGQYVSTIVNMTNLISDLNIYQLLDDVDDTKKKFNDRAVAKSWKCVKTAKLREAISRSMFGKSHETSDPNVSPHICCAFDFQSSLFVVVPSDIHGEFFVATKSLGEISVQSTDTFPLDFTEELASLGTFVGFKMFDDILKGIHILYSSPPKSAILNSEEFGTNHYRLLLWGEYAMMVIEGVMPFKRLEWRIVWVNNVPCPLKSVDSILWKKQYSRSLVTSLDMGGTIRFNLFQSKHHDKKVCNFEGICCDKGFVSKVLGPCSDYSKKKISMTTTIFNSSRAKSDDEIPCMLIGFIATIDLYFVRIFYGESCPPLKCHLPIKVQLIPVSRIVAEYQPDYIVPIDISCGSSIVVNNDFIYFFVGDSSGNLSLGAFCCKENDMDTIYRQFCNRDSSTSGTKIRKLSSKPLKVSER